jgi:hypothetical protein
MKVLINRSANPKTPAFMIAKEYNDFWGLRTWYKDIEESKLTVVIPRISHASLERANFARHPAVTDVGSLMGTYVPIFFNPAEVPWQDVPEIRTQHEAFFHAMKSMEQNDFSKDFLLSDETITERLSWLYERMIIFEDWVKHWCVDFEWAEQRSTEALWQHLEKDFVVPWMPVPPSTAPSDPNELAPSRSRGAAL